MRDAFGGAFMIRLFLVFIFIYMFFTAIALNYARAFKVKNKVIDYLEDNEIVTISKMNAKEFENMSDYFENEILGTLNYRLPKSEMNCQNTTDEVYCDNGIRITQIDVKSTKSDNLLKSQNNILSYKKKKNFNSSLKSITLKNSLINISNENSKLKLRNNSTNTNKNFNCNLIRKNSNINLSSSIQMNPTKIYHSYYRKVNSTNSRSKSKSKSKSKSRKKINYIKTKTLNEENNNNINNDINNNDIVDEKNEFKVYYYRLIKFGNDIKTIKKCFEHRENWQLAPESFKLDQINLVWAPMSNQINFNEINKDTKNITLMNHYEFHTQLSNKLKMFKNLLIYCEENKYDLFSFVPLTILIEYQSPFFLNQFQNFSFIFNNISSFLSERGLPKDNKKKYRNYFFYIDSSLDNKVGLKTTIYIPNTHYEGKNFWLIKAMNLNIVGIVVMAVFALIGYIVGALKIPTIVAFPITKKIGGEPIGEIILRYMKFKQSRKMYIYTKDEKKEEKTNE